MAFDAQITDLVGGTIDQTACDQWMEDGVRELINLFPKNLKEMCYSKNTFTSAAAGSEAETIASQHLGNVFAGSYICRKISGDNKYKASDSDEMLYATATDPVYYIEGGILNILPASSSGVYYLIPDPSIDASADSAISSFPNEAEYLVVLYASIKQLLQYQSTMSSSWDSDITTALTTINTELDKVDDIVLISYNKIVEYYTDIAELENADLWDDTNKRFDEVKLSLENAMSLIGFGSAGDKYATTHDLEANMLDIDTEIGNEDVELAGARMQQAQTQMAAVGSHLSTAQMAMAEINGLIQKHSLPLAGVSQLISTASGYISQANGYVAEAGARLQSNSARYQWYGDQHAKLTADYTRGLAALKGS